MQAASFLPAFFRWAAVLACMAAALVSNYWLDALLAQRPFCRRDLAIQCGLMAVEPVLARIGGMHMTVNAAGMVVLSGLIAGWAFQQRGVAWVRLTLKLIASLVALELICASLILPFVSWGLLPTDSISIQTLSDFLNPDKCLCMFGFGTASHVLAAGLVKAWRWLRQLTRRHGRAWLYIKVYIRMLALLVLGGGAMYTAATFWGTQLYAGQDFMARNARYLPQVLLSAGLLLVAVSYFTQDIRYIDQLRHNETLEKQQAISHSLLKNLRYFRHNMINMLYGLEGVILKGDTSELRAYYQDMAHRCALVNNENILALERVNDPAVSAVLLRAVDRAREKEMPFFLYVQQGIGAARGLRSSDTCQILGVLLDNALEAAAQSAEPSVRVEMRTVDGMLEILVCNTYAGRVDPALLSQGGHSTKEGHMGQGLASCYDILSRKKGAFLNFDVSGQYVRAQLLIRMKYKETNR